MTGNEAIARGVYEGIYAEWSPNEKTALEVAGGAATAGARAFYSMKHVGLNVAADPLFTLAYTGVTGSLVINNSCMLHTVHVHRDAGSQPEHHRVLTQEDRPVG